MNISENKELVEAIIISCFISVAYMMAYLIKGKDKSIRGGFRALSKALILILTAIIPVAIIVAGFRNMLAGKLNSVIITNILGLVFAIPFFSELMKGLTEDFKIPYKYTSNITNYLALTAAGLLLTMIFTFFTYEYISGEGTLSLPLICVFFAVVGTVSIILGKYKIKYYENPEKLKELKKIEQKIAWGLLVAFIILFILITFELL